MAFAIPVMLLNTILAWIWLLLLQRLYLGNEKKTKDQQDKAMKVIKEKYVALGKITLHELQVDNIDDKEHLKGVKPENKY